MTLTPRSIWTGLLAFTAVVALLVMAVTSFLDSKPPTSPATNVQQATTTTTTNPRNSSKSGASEMTGYRDGTHRIEFSYPSSWSVTQGLAESPLSSYEPVSAPVNLYAERELGYPVAVTIARYNNSSQTPWREWILAGHDSFSGTQPVAGSRELEGNEHDALERAYAHRVGILTYHESVNPISSTIEIGDLATAGRLRYSTFIALDRERLYSISIELPLDFPDTPGAPRFSVPDTTFLRLYRQIVDSFRVLP